MGLLCVSVWGIKRAFVEFVVFRTLFWVIPSPNRASFTQDFCHHAARLILGDDFVLSNKTRVTSVQAISGTGALRLAAEFVGKFMPGKPCYISNPSWGTLRCGANSAWVWRKTSLKSLERFEILFFPFFWPVRAHTINKVLTENVAVAMGNGVQVITSQSLRRVA